MKNRSIQTRPRFHRILVPIASLVLLSSTALAGVSPDSVVAVKNPGDSFTIQKVVATPAIPPKPDVVFLADATGSMGGAIANVRAGSTSIMNAVKSAQDDSQFGAASYRDAGDAYVFRVEQDVTASIPAVQNGINSWTAAGGGDREEAQLYALRQLATGAASFRAGSSRIVVWFGDQPGHNPSVGGVSLSSTIDALKAAKIRVIAVSTGANLLNEGGQAVAITSATGGLFISGINDNLVADAILDALGNLPVTVSYNIQCDPGLSLVLTPTSAETIISGGNVTYDELISVDPLNPGGVTLNCTIKFLLNGLEQDGFTETVSVTVNGADMSIVKAGPALVTEGNSYAYTLTALNNGPATATNVTVTDSIPANATFGSAPGCSFAAGQVSCVVASLASGASESFTVNVTAQSAGNSITNTGTVTADQFDPLLANNSSTVVTKLNHNPICTAVTGGPNLWPPNHKFRTIRLSGATDPDGDPLNWSVTGVTQDELLNGLGDGDTSPDAVLGVGNELQLRAERSGLEDGRVYRIAFTVTDGLGGSCTGVANVGVPHDQRPGSVAVDSGLIVNSLS
jgi:uncharacterized repeat protein (TIGR01451 family)